MAKLGGKAGFALALAIGLALVGVVVALNDPATIAWRIATSRPEYLVLAAVFDFISIVFYALAWVVTAKALGIDLGLVDGLVASILGLFADKLVASASISCEAVRLAYVKSRRDDVSYEELLATIMVHRFLYNVAFVALIAVAFVDLALSGPVPHVLAILLALAILSTVVASYVLAKPESLKGVARSAAAYVERGLARAFRVTGLNLADRAGEFVEGIAESVKKAVERKWYMVLAVLLMILQWVAGAIEFYAVFMAVGHRVSMWVALVVFPLHCFLTALPVGLPAALGVVETGTLFMLVTFGVDGATAMAVTLLTRAVEVWFEIGLAVAVALAVGAWQYGPQLLKYAEELASGKRPQAGLPIPPLPRPLSRLGLAKRWPPGGGPEGGGGKG